MDDNVVLHAPLYVLFARSHSSVPPTSTYWLNASAIDDNVVLHAPLFLKVLFARSHSSEPPTSTYVHPQLNASVVDSNAVLRVPLFLEVLFARSHSSEPPPSIYCPSTAECVGLCKNYRQNVRLDRSVFLILDGQNDNVAVRGWRLGRPD